MTTYGTFDDSVPAPSDVELAAADIARHTIATRREPPTLSHAQLEMVDSFDFFAFCKSNAIYADRKPFYAFVDTMREIGQADGRGMLALWLDFGKWGRAATIAAQDVRDQRETQQDALR